MSAGMRSMKMFSNSWQYVMPICSILLVYKSSIQQSPALCSKNQMGIDSGVHTLMLDHACDKYGGIIITDKLTFENNDFNLHLEHSLEKWKLLKKKGIWLKIPIEKIHLAKIAVAKGFKFHHAEKGYLMLTTWLEDSENTLPQNASHQVGVGCIVCINGKILCVQEKYGQKGIWKVPTGAVDAGEDLAVAAVRRVKEETGISTVFRGVAGIRHSHNWAFGKSDLYFMCVLSPLTTEIVIQESGIEACEWKTFDAYFSQPFPIYSKGSNEVIKAVFEGKQNLMEGKFFSWLRGSTATFYNPPTVEDVTEKKY